MISLNANSIIVNGQDLTDHVSGYRIEGGPLEPVSVWLEFKDPDFEASLAEKTVAFQGLEAVGAYHAIMELDWERIAQAYMQSLGYDATLDNAKLSVRQEVASQLTRRSADGH